ncbi:hypothetical protein ACXGQW_07930 [Wenyingzhuangia sp. IMCC45533]
MKKLLLFAVMFIGLSINAQKKQTQRPDFTVEQKVQLMIKKMSIHLDLEAHQINKIKPLITAKINKMDALKEEHKASKKQLTSDEKFELAMNKLEDEAKLYQQMGKILSNKQFETWKIMHAKHGNKRKGSHKKSKHCSQV